MTNKKVNNHSRMSDSIIHSKRATELRQTHNTIQKKQATQILPTTLSKSNDKSSKGMQTLHQPKSSHECRGITQGMTQLKHQQTRAQKASSGPQRNQRKMLPRQQRISQQEDGRRDRPTEPCQRGAEEDLPSHRSKVP